MRIIDKTSGLQAVLEVISNPMKLLKVYNNAIEAYKNKDEQDFKFDKGLVENVLEIGIQM